MPAKQKSPTPGKRVVLAMRVAPDVKDRLDASALKNGRSQSQEAELRLTESLRSDDLIGDMIRSQARPVFDYLTALGSLKIDITPETVDAVAAGADLILRAISAGGIPEERVRQLWIEDIAQYKNQRAVDALTAAFNILVFARLAPPLTTDKFSEWLRRRDDAR
jgi:TraY domain